jgi:enoyl-CoA hydratase/carnithine racemase
MRNQLIQTILDGNIATIVLNRPDKLNAMNRSMWLELAEIFIEIAANPAIRCVILRGAGKTFSPGADISEFTTERNNPNQACIYGRVMEDTYSAIRSTPQPIIAMIQGPCTGAGLVLALLCDLRIGATSARFGAPVSKLGIAMPLSEFSVLYEVLGRSCTLEILLEARIFNADEALVKRILTRVVPDDKLETAVAESAQCVVAGAPLVNKWHKAFASRLATKSPLTETDFVTSYESFGTLDYREGVAAFFEKRAPVFQNK